MMKSYVMRTLRVRDFLTIVCYINFHLIIIIIIIIITRMIYYAYPYSSQYAENVAQMTLDTMLRVASVDTDKHTTTVHTHSQIHDFKKSALKAFNISLFVWQSLK